MCKVLILLLLAPSLADIVSVEVVNLRASFVTLPLWFEDASAGLSVDAFRPAYGYIPDMLQAIVNRANSMNSSLQFTVSYRPAPDGLYGGFANGSWSGIVGDLIRDRADIAVGILSQTYARDQVVTFLPPFRAAPFGLVTLATVADPPFWEFVSPFNGTVWACLLVLVVAIALVTWIADRL